MAKKINEDIKEQIKKFAGRKYTISEIARSFKLHRNTISRILKEDQAHSTMAQAKMVGSDIKQYMSTKEALGNLVKEIQNLYNQDEYFKNEMNKAGFIRVKDMENQFLERSKNLIREYNLDSEDLNKLNSYSAKLIAMGIDLKDFENFVSNYNTVSAQMQKIKNLNSEIEDLEVEIGNLENTKRQYIKIVSDLDTEIDNKDAENNELERRKKSIKKEIEILEQNKKELEKDIERMRDKINELNEEHASMQKEHENRIEELKKKYEKIVPDLAEITVLGEFSRLLTSEKKAVEHFMGTNLNINDTNDIIFINTVATRLDLSVPEILKWSLRNRNILTDAVNILIKRRLANAIIEKLPDGKRNNDPNAKYINVGGMMLKLQKRPNNQQKA